MWFTTLALANPTWNLIDTEVDWRALTAVSAKETGEIVVEQKTVSGTLCLRGRMTIPTAPDALYDVVTDIATEPRWSSETLTASEILRRDGTTLDYYQHLAVPRWTMASDRFWVLRGRDASAKTAREFRWERFDWVTEYPELEQRIQREQPGAVEPQANLGFWRFTPGAAGTVATYAICTSAGGSIPQWIQKKAATQALPGTMADVAREARRRARGG
jgi:hypothetical protein